MLKSLRSVNLVIWTVFFVTVLGDTIQTSVKDAELVDASTASRSAALMHSSLLFGLLSEIVLPDSVGSKECRQDVGIVLDGIDRRSVWALKSRRISSNEFSGCIVLYNVCCVYLQFWMVAVAYRRRLCLATIFGSRPANCAISSISRCIFHCQPLFQRICAPIY